MDTTTTGSTGVAVVPAWPSMRGDRRNTGARLFRWDGVRRAIRSLDTGAATTPPTLSLINATPIVGPDETIYVGSSNQYFFAFPVDGPPSACRVGNIVDSAGCFVDPRTLYFPCGDYSLYSLSPLPHGTPEPHTLKGTVHSASTINWFEGNVVTDGAGRLYAGCDNFHLFGCDASGAPFFRWGFPTGFFIWSACALSDDGSTAYFVSADMTCYALDLQTTRAGERQRWACDIDNLCASSPALTADGRILVGAFDGLFYGIDAASGKRLWAFDTGSLIYASPAVSDRDQRAFVMSSDGVLRAFDVSGGQPQVLWEFFTGMPSFSSPAIGPDPEGKAAYLVHVGSGDGSVFALTPDGRRRWSYDTAAVSPNVLRYPAINSSIALGNQGVVTATSGGLIVSIPYDAYLHEQEGFTTNPEDDYVAQLPASGVRLCYVSPAGRMAETVVSPGGSEIAIDPEETLTFAALGRGASADGRPRSAFVPLPAGLRVTIEGDAHVTWRLSADGTQLYVDPPPGLRAFVVSVADASGASLAMATCRVGGVSQPSAPAQVLAGRYVIQQMSIAAPFVVPALDQLGIATIEIRLRFLSIEGDAAVAYAYESYSSSAAGTAGTPTRNLVYVFTGRYADGAFRLESAPSYFELTGAAIAVDRLTLSGAIGEELSEWRGVSLTAAYRLTAVAVAEWFLTYLSHWVSLGGGDSSDERPSFAPRRAPFDFGAWIKGLKRRVTDALSPWGPVVRFLLRLIGRDLTKPWKLFDQQDAFFWVGTYSLGAGVLPLGSAPQATYKYDGFLETLTVTVRLAEPSPEGEPPVVGIVLFDDAAGGAPLMLNYVDRNGSPTYSSDRQSITQTLNMLFDGTEKQPGVRLRAQVMVNLEIATPAFNVPSS